MVMPSCTADREQSTVRHWCMDGRCLPLPGDLHLGRGMRRRRNMHPAETIFPYCATSADAGP